jgi:hypothetical protein
MSPRAIYLRDQAAKCEWRAKNMGNRETQTRLRKLAAEYVVQADEKSEAGHRQRNLLPEGLLVMRKETSMKVYQETIAPPDPLPVVSTSLPMWGCSTARSAFSSRRTHG